MPDLRGDPRRLAISARALSDFAFFNPLAFVTYCAIAAFDLYALAVLILRAPRLRFTGFTSGERAAVRYSVLALLAANWLYLLALSALIPRIRR